MTRLYLSALATGILCLASTSTASAKGLLNFGRSNHGCGCEVEVTCGCEPTCGVDPCCDPCGGRKGLLSGLFSRSKSCCDPAPACGCEPACGVETSCCDTCAPSPCSRRPIFGYHLRRAFKSRSRCHTGCGCEPACGMEVVSCGCEPACGVDAGCGCNSCGRGHHLRSMRNHLTRMFRCRKPTCSPCQPLDMFECGCGH